MDNFYRVYGLNLRSDCHLAGLSQAHPGAIDVAASFASEPAWLPRAKRLPVQNRLVRRSENELDDPAFTLSVLGAEEFFLLQYSDGARFIVDHAANRLWGECPPPLTMEDLGTYLLGPVLGFVLRRRGRLALHASCAAVAGHGVLLVGPAEAGKSTTAAALALRGESILCEDIAPLAEESRLYFVEPGYPRVCLWPDSVEKLFGAPDALPLLTPNWEKRFLPLDGVRANHATERLPLGVIYLFATRTAEGRAPCIEPLSPRDALLELVQNTYMNFALDRMQRAAEFDALSRLVEGVPMRRLVPHADPAKLAELCELVLDDARRIFGTPQTAAALHA